MPVFPRDDCVTAPAEAETGRHLPGAQHTSHLC